MRLVMTLLARDEADIVDAQIAFHLHAGVDFVVATDHRSEDGTTAILERYEREGRLYLIREGIGDIRQAEWVTRMARLAATDFEADWVVNADADEFWWPREGSLKDVLSTVPSRFGVVRCCWRHFLPRPDDGWCFAERMTMRLTRPASPGEKESIYHAYQKVAHRSSSGVLVEKGKPRGRWPAAPAKRPSRCRHAFARRTATDTPGGRHLRSTEASASREAGVPSPDTTRRRRARRGDRSAVRDRRHPARVGAGRGNGAADRAAGARAPRTPA